MTNLKYGIVSMLTTDEQTTLFTDTGNMIVLDSNSEYNIVGISEYLTPLLTGTASVELDLAEFIKPVIEGLDLGDGIAMVHTIEGKKVQGVFYPVSKTEVTVEVEGETVTVPDVENLKSHMERANEESSPSISNFLKRLAPVIKGRKHSAEDLMAFIKKSQLPITNNGRIIAYKRVKTMNGHLVDCHTGKIIQDVGNRVQMDISMVDPDRNKSCSHGLHVCNLGYLKGFYGDTVLITLVDPTNFIAVPHNETTKARVKSYDIIGKVKASESDLTNNKDLELIVSNAVDGNSIKPHTLVTIKEGGIIEYTTMAGTPISKNMASHVLPVHLATGKTPAKPSSGKPLEEKASVTSSVVAAVRKIKKAVAPTLAEQARKLYNQNHFPTLRTFKRGKKKSWYALGFNDTEIDRIMKDA